MISHHDGSTSPMLIPKFGDVPNTGGDVSELAILKEVDSEATL